MGEIKLNASKILIVGGYNAAGNGQTAAGILTNTGAAAGTWTRLVNGLGASNPLPTALGEVEIAQITASKFIVAGGRATRDGAAVTNAWLLTLNVATAVASWTAVNMSQARVIGKNNLQKCGSTGSRFIAIGGITNGGMASTTTTNATDNIEVFNAATPAWSTLKLAGSSGTKTVQLPTNGKGYHSVLSPNVSSFIVAGGVTNAVATAVKTVQLLAVNSSCEALTTSVVDPSLNPSIVKTSATDMPSERARGAWIKATGSLNTSPVFNYDFIIATGNNTTRFSNTPPTDIFFYDSANDKWNGTFADLRTNGRVFGRLVQDESGTANWVRMGTGVVPSGTGTNVLLDTTPILTDIINNSGVVNPGGVTGTDITNGRVGSAVQLFGNTPADYAAFGTAYAGGTATAKTDVFDF